MTSPAAVTRTLPTARVSTRSDAEGGDGDDEKDEKEETKDTEIKHIAKQFFILMSFLIFEEWIYDKYSNIKDLFL